MADTKVETIAKLVQWRVESFGSCPYKKSDAFKVGIWNWYLSIERNRYLYVRLYPESSRVSKEQPPIARFIVRVSCAGADRRPYVTPIQRRVLRNSEDFLWPIDCSVYGRLVIDVEFLDLKISALNGGEAISVWPSIGPMQTVSAQTALRSLSLMLHDTIHTDVTINTKNGSIRAHKAILAASSPVFHTMFQHNLAENQSSTVDIEDMSWESSSALLAYLYGDMKYKDFWMQRLSLLGAANKYDIADLKEACEESLLEDIDTENVLERLQVAWLYQLHKLKKGCFVYLFEFGKIHDVKDEIGGFFRGVDKDLMLEMFLEVVSVWKPL